MKQRTRIITCSVAGTTKPPPPHSPSWLLPPPPSPKPPTSPSPSHCHYHHHNAAATATTTTTTTQFQVWSGQKKGGFTNLKIMALLNGIPEWHGSMAFANISIQGIPEWHATTQFANGEKWLFREKLRTRLL